MGKSEQGGVRRPAGSNLPFDGVAVHVMAARHHDALRGMLDFEFKNHPQCPVAPARLDALNRFMRSRVHQLLRMRPVSEEALCAEIADALPPDAPISAAEPVLR